MPKILVHKAFGLLLSATAAPQRFEKGEHEVSDEVADHWYTAEHATVLVAPVPGPVPPPPAPAPAPAPEPLVAVSDGDGADETDEANGPDDRGGGEGAEGEDGADADTKDEAPDFDAMTADELRAYLKERDGRAPHPKTGHEKLLAAAKGPVEA